MYFIRDKDLNAKYHSLMLIFEYFSLSDIWHIPIKRYTFTWLNSFKYFLKLIFLKVPEMYAIYLGRTILPFPLTLPYAICFKVITLITSLRSQNPSKSILSPSYKTFLFFWKRSKGHELINYYWSFSTHNSFCPQSKKSPDTSFL